MNDNAGRRIQSGSEDEGPLLKRKKKTKAGASK